MAVDKQTAPEKQRLTATLAGDTVLEKPALFIRRLRAERGKLWVDANRRWSRFGGSGVFRNRFDVDNIRPLVAVAELEFVSGWRFGRDEMRRGLRCWGHSPPRWPRWQSAWAWCRIGICEILRTKAVHPRKGDGLVALMGLPRTVTIDLLLRRRTSPTSAVHVISDGEQDDGHLSLAQR